MIIEYKSEGNMSRENENEFHIRKIKLEKIKNLLYNLKVASGFAK